MSTLILNKKSSNTIFFSFLLIILSIKPTSATPACQIVTQNFSSSSDGATSDNGTYGWSLSHTIISVATYWEVQSHRFKAQEICTEGVWSSKVMNISKYQNVQIGVKLLLRKHIQAVNMSK